MPNTQRTVLVVDDVLQSARALADALEGAGYTVHIATSADIAQSSAAQTSAEDAETSIPVEPTALERADLLLISMDLANADALALLRRIRASTERRYQPVLMLASGDDRDRRLAAFQLGADDVIQKPWEPDELIARIRQRIRVRRRVDELLAETAELHQLSVTDSLTHLYNHRFFQERLKDEFRRAQRHSDPLALVLLDLDRFKAVNDRHGHPAGDLILRDVAQAIREHLRDTDVLARYGGEEFAIILPRTHLAGALTVAERVWRAVGGLRTGPDRSVHLTASIGVSGFPSRSILTPDQLLRSTDEALYRAKRDGGDRISLFQQVSFFTSPPAKDE